MHRARLVWVAVVLLLGISAAGASAAVVPSGTMQVSVAGRITSDTGQGVGGMCVLVETEQRSLVTVAQATSRSDGSYRVSFQQDRNQTGDYAVVANARCGADGRWQSASYPGTATVTSSAGKNNVSGIDMTTLPAGRVVGRVTNAVTGSPVSGLLIEAYSNNGLEQAWTQPDGSYLIGGLSGGGYALWLNAVGADGAQATQAYLSQYAPAQPTYAAATQYPVSVGQDTVVEVSVVPSDTIAGRVTEGRTGRPLKGIEVNATSVDGSWGTSRTVTTDQDGYYVADGLGPGDYQVCFRPGTAHSSRCYANKKPSDAPTLVTVTGYGAAVHHVNQSLPIGPGR